MSAGKAGGGTIYCRSRRRVWAFCSVWRENGTTLSNYWCTRADVSVVEKRRRLQWLWKFDEKNWIFKSYHWRQSYIHMRCKKSCWSAKGHDQVRGKLNLFFKSCQRRFKDTQQSENFGVISLCDKLSVLSPATSSDIIVCGALDGGRWRTGEGGGEKETVSESSPPPLVIFFCAKLFKD